MGEQIPLLLLVKELLHILWAQVPQRYIYFFYFKIFVSNIKITGEQGGLVKYVRVMPLLLLYEGALTYSLGPSTLGKTHLFQLHILF